MSWLGELLNHLTVSKGLVWAIFVTSLILIAGPYMAPDWFDPVPNNWRWIVVGSGVFTLTLIVMWIVPPIFRGLVSTPGRIRNSPRWNPPNEAEEAFIFLLGRISPNEFLDLDSLNNPKMPKLELLALCSSLDKKGLLHIHQYNDNLVELTAEGRAYALKLNGRSRTSQIVQVRSGLRPPPAACCARAA
jgi:hypothetical protein